MNAPIINLADVECHGFRKALPAHLNERYGGVRIGEVGTAIGAQKLGYNVTAVPPGERAFPLHNHRINEEMFFVIEGTGEIRIGDATHAIRAGDVIACPPGGPESAHQIVNTSDSELRYLAISTLMSPEICEYPESGKFGVMTERPTESGGESWTFRYLGRTANSLSYWDGE